MTPGVGIRALTIGLAVAFLAACGDAQTGSRPVPAGETDSKARSHEMSGSSGVLYATGDGKSWMSRKANHDHAWLYVSDTANSVVYIYELAKTGASLIGEITDGLNGPFGLTVDKSGNLYVANQNTPGNVLIYPPGKTSPSLTLSEGLTTPQGVAVDASGNVLKN